MYRIIPKYASHVWSAFGTARQLTFNSMQTFCFSSLPSSLFDRFICPVKGKILNDDLTDVPEFDIFGVPHSFDVDTDKLENVYKTLQKKLHPDLLHGRPSEEQEAAARHSSVINDAYNVLKRPYERSLVLLALNGIRIDENTTSPDPALLMEVMEVREELEAASNMSGEAGNVLRQSLGENNRTKIESAELNLSRLFKENNFQEATSETIRLRYLLTINNEVHGLID